MQMRRRIERGGFISSCSTVTCNDDTFTMRDVTEVYMQIRSRSNAERFSVDMKGR